MIALPITFSVDGQGIVDVLLPQLRRILMNQADLKTALDGVATQLTDFGAALDADIAQLNKAQDEIVLALQQIGTTIPAVDAAVASLQAAASSLTGKQGAIGTVAASLDGLNPDVTPAP